MLLILFGTAVALGYALGPGSRVNGYAIERFLNDYETEKEISFF